MTFELLPIIDTMLDLYETPRSFERFQTYLKTLQGDTKSDLALPIGGFNPMAKGHIIDKLTELKDLHAEQIMAETLVELSKKLPQQMHKHHFKVALNVSDDLYGGWTNRFTSDYDSKFRFGGLFNKKFCTPIFWTSEHFTETEIKKKAAEYALRTVYWFTNSKPITLQEHLLQEVFVAEQSGFGSKWQAKDTAGIASFYNQHQQTEDYSIILNFFYGDEASKSLGLPIFGIDSTVTGFDYSTTLIHSKT